MKSFRSQLELVGFDEAVRIAATEAETPQQAKVMQKRVEKAFEILTEDPQDAEMAFLHSGLCQTCLPHSRPATNHDVWTRSSGRFTLMVQPGVLRADTRDVGSNIITGKGSSDYVGVPYGPKARLILIYLQSEGLKSRVVSLGATQTAFMRSLGLSITGGRRGSINAVKEQTLRLTRCQFVLQYTSIAPGGEEHTQLTDARITDGLDFWKSSSGEWNGVVELNQKFHENLLEHAVPLDKRGIAHLVGNSLGLDLYTFFAYRLPKLTKPLELSWAQLQGQVGAELKQHRQLGARIREILPDVMAAYPAANVEVTQRGLLLRPSPCVVPRTQVRGVDVRAGKLLT